MTQIKLRRDTSANFTSANPVLGVGEPAYETDTKKLKIGDGTTAYTQLEYFSTGGGGSNLRYPVEVSDKSLMPSWYVVYNDGWIEQGGYSLASANATTLTFLKPFTKTDYLIIGSRSGANGTLNIPSAAATKLVDSFQFFVAEIGGEIYWSACGY